MKTLKISSDLADTLRQALCLREMELQRCASVLSTHDYKFTERLIDEYKKELRNIDVLLRML